MKRNDHEENRTNLENICHQCLCFFRWTEQTDGDDAETDADVEDVNWLEKDGSTPQSHRSAESQRAEQVTE